MHGKLTAAGSCGVAYLVCVFLAQLAAAAPVMTHPTGTVLATGAALTGTNLSAWKMASSQGTILCSRISLTGTVTNNATAQGFKANVLSMLVSDTGEGGECTSWTGGVSAIPTVVGGLPWCLEATAASDEGKVRGGTCSELSRGIKFAFDFTSIGTCVYNRSAAAVLTFTTDPDDAVMHLSGQERLKVEGRTVCPGSTVWDMTFTFETDTSPGSSPMYISP